MFFVDKRYNCLYKKKVREWKSEETALGIREYGDDFALSVEQTERDSEYSAGAEFDSTSEEATGWYVRTDEEGEPIPYDYEAGEYIAKQEARDLGHTDIQEVVDGRAQDT